ncbi:ParB/RepB/Spo0J family partition protein [Texcoconibacillus texcoconensis]|uniref:ParB family chromosome partitioning protein n=1 Tax=Texcoconibacillus texcoconensis TaxID=1095777 RepID=A0A840QTY5_9BACI|nr:ParB/RepB/Spo0J family partition protein [Texcoconibacillus texcoconensis]MBB5174773.1 ParB family chromosome partitioning protein [Texcoconibacillus texcoconensis]
MARGLGKGISAFFPDAESESVQDEQIKEVSLSELRPNPYQPRKSFSDESINELKESIQQHGVLQPLIVRTSIKGYEIVVGERRYRAAKEAKLETIPVVIRDLTDDQMMEMALIENIQREDLNPLEEAKAYQKLLEHAQVTQEELARKLGKSRPHVANHLRLLQLPELAQSYIAEGKLSMGHGRALLGLKSQDALAPLIQKVIKEQWSVRQLEEWIQQKNDRVSRETKEREPKLSPFLKEKEATLRDYFGTSVSIKPGKKKGKIEIDYFSEDDLERVLSLLQQQEQE